MQLLDRSFDASTRPAGPAAMDERTLRSVEQFLFREARLLDERRLHDWLALWSPEGRYWVPRFPGQDNPFDQISLFWEDGMLRETRVRRLQGERGWSQQPPTRTVRLVGAIEVEGLDAGGRLVVHSVLQLTEFQRDLRQLAARVCHKLEGDANEGWRLYLKRVDLVNCEDAFASLEMFL